MKLYLNNNEIKKDYGNLSLSELLSKIKNKLDDKIISSIYINNVEVNQKYLTEALIKKEEIRRIKFETKSTDLLIEETLAEITDYLPRLKKGCLETADLFRSGKLNEANNKYQLILKGIEWYTKVISNIVGLMDAEKINSEIKDQFELLNITLNEIVEAHQNDDNILIADILEYELKDFIDFFIKTNKNLINIYKGKSDHNDS